MAVQKHFRDVIQREFRIASRNIEIKPHAVQFTVDGVDFDLQIAENLANTHSAG